MRIIEYEIGLGFDNCTHISFVGIPTDNDEIRKIVDSYKIGMDINIMNGMPSIEKVIFNKPATIVLWEDGTKTVVKCSSKDIWNPEKGLSMCIIKKICGNDNSYHKIFKKWIPENQYEFFKEALHLFEANYGIPHKKSEIDWFISIECGQEIYECSECGHVQKTVTNYCPNCGGRKGDTK